MDVVIVYKPDRTIQGEERTPVPLQDHARELTDLGVRTIYGERNVMGPAAVLSVGGLPTGRVNAFAVAKDEWFNSVVRGSAGPQGFALWACEPLPDLGLDGECRVVRSIGEKRIPAGVGDTPLLIRKLIGRPIRCYQQGDELSKEFIPNRVNVEHDKDQRITDIWFG